MSNFCCCFSCLFDALVRDTKYAEVKSSPGRTSALPGIAETVQVVVPLQEEVAQELLELREKGIDIDMLIKTADNFQVRAQRCTGAGGEGDDQKAGIIARTMFIT